jgi:hypothetical protein
MSLIALACRGTASGTWSTAFSSRLSAAQSTTCRSICSEAIASDQGLLSPGFGLCSVSAPRSASTSWLQISSNLTTYLLTSRSSVGSATKEAAALSAIFRLSTRVASGLAFSSSDMNSAARQSNSFRRRCVTSQRNLRRSVSIAWRWAEVTVALACSRAASTMALACFLAAAGAKKNETIQAMRPPANAAGITTVMSILTLMKVKKTCLSAN